MVSELSWQDAIIKVLKEAEEPLHSNRIAALVEARGLRNFSNSATPERTANRELNRMARDDETPIVRIESGVFLYIDPDAPDSEVQKIEDDDQVDDQPTEDPGARVQVSAFGLLWEKSNVNWGRGCKILGRQVRGAAPIDFSEQQGVYILHKGNSIVYVGRTSDTLRSRLREHASTPGKGFRWDRFSWFGFRPVNEDGTLEDVPNNVTSSDLFSILESVLIEALEPPVNGRRGDRMGELYEQVTDHRIEEQQALLLVQTLAQNIAIESKLTLTDQKDFRHA